MEPDTMPSFPEQALSEHGAFVRRLAKRLLTDAHLADDVAQEAWSRYFAAPPASANPRGWFARTVRNLATNSLRARARRAEHEQRGARAEPQRSGAEEAEQAEVLRTLVEAVLALEPAQRDTLLALYFRGVDAKTLARESGVPEPTVRDRQRRALATLRQRLDRSCGGRSAWSAQLARFTAEEPLPLPPLLSTGLAAAGLVLAGSLGVFAFVRSGERELATKAQLVTNKREVWIEEPVTPSEPTLVRAEPSLAPLRAELEPDESSSSDASASSALTAEFSTLRGRFVASDGRPLGGVPFDLVLTEGDWEAGFDEDLPAPEGWENPSGTSDSDGHFELVLMPTPQHILELHSRAEGFVAVRIPLSGSRLLTGHDVGDLMLYSSARLAGRVVDPSGNPMIGFSWRVSAPAHAEVPDRDRYAAASGSIDPLTARYELGGLLPGMNRVFAHAQITDAVGHDVDLVEGASLELDLVYSGADPHRRLIVDPATPRLSALTHLVDSTRFRLRAPDGSERAATESGGPGTPIRRTFDGLEPRLSYTLEFDDPRFEPFYQAGIQPGQVLRPSLRGNSGLRILAVEATNEAPLDSARATLLGVNFWPREIRLAATELVEGRCDGLVAGDYRVEVTSGQLRGELRVDSLAPGETRILCIELQAGASLAGRVVDELGEPSADLELLAVRPADVADGETSPLLRQGSSASPADLRRTEIAATRTDPAGTFAFELEKAQTVLLMVVHAIGASTLGEALVLAPGERREGLVFTVPRSARLNARVSAPPGQSLDAMRFVVMRRAATSYDWDVVRSVLIESDGLVELAGLRADRYRVFLRPPEVGRLRVTANSRSVEGDSTCLDEQRGWISNALVLGDLELQPGQTANLEYPVGADQWPGVIELELLVDGAPIPDWDVRIIQEEYCNLERSTDRRGQLAPVVAVAGLWRVEIQDPLTGWKHTFPDPLVVQPAQLTRQMLAVERP